MKSGGTREGAAPEDEGPRRFAGLRPGDRVAVVAPSGPVDPARLEAGCGVLRDLGLEVVLGGHVLDRANLAGAAARDGWHRLAGTDADRAADLQAAWCDPDVRAVLCARGGYGATRLLDLLDWDALAAASATDRGPKLLHGSSDITALHVAFGARLGVSTSFGPMVAGLVADLAGPLDADRERTLAHLRSALFADPAGTTVTGSHALSPGRAQGVLTGGTLALLTALIGTSHAPPPAAGRIVLLEDVCEAPYRVDRMLTQLLQAGWFDGAAGVVLGSWTDCGDPAELDAVFTDRLGPLGVPVLAGVPAGHGPCQVTLELGAPVRLDAAALTLSVPAGRRASDSRPLPGGVR